MTEAEKQHFLANHDNAEGHWKASTSSQSTVKRTIKYLQLVIIICLSLTCGILAIYVRDLQARVQEVQLNVRPDSASFLSPARGAIEYQWDSPPEQDTWFRGKPRHDFAEQWRKIATGTLIRVTKDDLELAGENGSVALTDGGFAAGLAVSHHLHCVKRIKNFIWLEDVAPQKAVKGTPEYIEAKEHADHCIDTLRQHVMCNADISLQRLIWGPHSKITGTPGALQSSPRVCMNWDRLHNWMKEHSTSSKKFIKPDSLAAP